MRLAPRLFMGYDPNGAAPTDALRAYRKLVLHMNGTDTSTTFTDNSPIASTITVNGNAQIDTAISVFGGASGLFDGTGDYLTTPSSTDYGIGTSDYCVEGWIYKNALGSAQRCLFDTRSGGAGIAIYASTTTPNATDRLVLANNAAIIAGTSTTLIADTTWTHWAVCRQGTTVRGFLAGTQVWSVTDSRTLAASTACYIGANNGAGDNFIGSLDEVILTIGYAPYTANFTPPATELPDA